jgi:hypothetical protein
VDREGWGRAGDWLRESKRRTFPDGPEGTPPPLPTPSPAPSGLKQEVDAMRTEELRAYAPVGFHETPIETKVDGVETLRCLLWR